MDCGIMTLFWLLGLVATVQMFPIGFIVMERFA